MKVPYNLIAAVPPDGRYHQMAHAVRIATERGYPRLTEHPIGSEILCVACYGPSLADTYRDLTHPILSMSGATQFLADRGVVADYHVDMDPRPHKVKHLVPPIPGVTYLMASVCPPETWEILKDHETVTLWHTYSGANTDGKDTYAWVAEHDNGELVVHGGSTIGLTALHIGGVLGYRHFEIHGMDGSIRDGVRHAGPHYGKPQSGITWAAEGVTYQTSQTMANAVAETINTIRVFPVFCVFHGSGLTQALVREANIPNACTVEQTTKAATIRRAFIRVADIPRGSSGGSYWDALIDPLPKESVPELIQVIREAEPRRAKAKFNTGTISLETALLLRAVCAYHRPKVIVEIGTFIGTSTRALQAQDRLYTCDRDNDCLPPSGNITVHPYTTSTTLLTQLVEAQVTVDLFFFDGRIAIEDVALIQQLSHAKTLYLTDDYVKGKKGVKNIRRLIPITPDHGVVPPNAAYKGRSTLSALVPMTRL